MARTSFLTGLGGLLSAKLIGSWMSTLDYRAALYDPAIDLASPACRGQKIYIFWHENILFPLYLRGHCNLAMLLSQHRDADLLARVALHFGFDCVRGSTYRGASTAVRELLRRSASANIAITPDGPRGPRRCLAQGPVYLSSRLGLPLVALGLGYERPWRARSWDRFAIPQPYSRARAIVSPQLHIPADLDRDGLEHYRGQVERLLTRLTDEAEAWATAGTRRVGEMAVFKQPAPTRVERESYDAEFRPSALCEPLTLREAA